MHSEKKASLFMLYIALLSQYTQTRDTRQKDSGYYFEMETFENISSARSVRWVDSCHELGVQKCGTTFSQLSLQSFIPTEIRIRCGVCQNPAKACWNSKSKRLSKLPASCSRAAFLHLGITTYFLSGKRLSILGCPAQFKHFFCLL